jgi:hypothetical protein
MDLKEIFLTLIWTSSGRFVLVVIGLVLIVWILARFGYAFKGGTHVAGAAFNRDGTRRAAIAIKSGPFFGHRDKVPDASELVNAAGNLADGLIGNPQLLDVDLKRLEKRRGTNGHHQ